MPDIEETAKAIVHLSIKVHKTLGPGLLESVYQKCLAYELEAAGYEVTCETSMPVQYGTISIDMCFRADMIVDNQVIIENKTVDKIAPIHGAQLLTYLKITGLHLGFLLNWNVIMMKDGIRRMINYCPLGHGGLPDRPPRSGKNKKQNLSVLRALWFKKLKRNAQFQPRPPFAFNGWPQSWYLFTIQDVTP